MEPPDEVQLRRAGVGDAAVVARLNEHVQRLHVDTHGLSALHLDSWLFNEAAHAFFRRLGFAPFVVRFERVVASLPTPPVEAGR